MVVLFIKTAIIGQQNIDIKVFLQQTIAGFVLLHKCIHATVKTTRSLYLLTKSTSSVVDKEALEAVTGCVQEEAGENVVYEIRVCSHGIHGI